MRLALTFRILYALLIVQYAVRGVWDSVWFHLAVFVVTFPVFLLVKRRPALSRMDAAITALFSLSIVSGLFGHHLHATIFGADKLFHFAGGVILAALADATLPRTLSPNWRYALTVLLVLAVGAGWEVFEWAFFSLSDPGRDLALVYVDSMLDLVADTLGAAVHVGYSFLRSGKA